MPSPYYDDRDKHRPLSPPSNRRYTPPPRQEYRRGDAPFQIPIWVVILTFCFGMWPVSIVLLVLNHLLRTGQIRSDAFRTNRKYAPTRSIYAQPTASNVQPGNPAPQPPKATPHPAAGQDSEAGINVLAVAGVIVGAIGLLATVSSLHEMIFYGGWDYWHLYVEDVIAGSLPLFAGIGMYIGSNIMRTGRRIRRKIDKIVGDADHMYIKEIADAIPCSYDKCCRRLEECIDKGLFGEDAYLDMRTRCLVVRGDAPKPQQATRPAEPKAPAKPQSEYDKTLIRLRELNDAIPDEEMSDRIARLEAVTAKIFAQAESDPEKLPQMRKFLDYYLPTSLKLLEAYAEMDAQGIEGENISESKRRIEQAMGTLVTAFENQLDKLFQSDALDLSADIDVMEKMLQADGLAGEDPFSLKTPRAPEAPKMEL